MRLPPDSPDPVPPGPSVRAPYDAEIFADLLIDNPDGALHLLAGMSEQERLAQARAYAAWLHGFGLPIAVEDILANWAARLSAKGGLMSLWRTADEQDWVLIPISAQEIACVERVREVMQHALAEYLGEGVMIGVRTGKLLVYLHGADTADHRLASAAVLRVQAALASYYRLADPADRRALATALADDFAARYGETLMAAPPDSAEAQR